MGKTWLTHVTLSLLQSFTDGRMDADMADEDDVPMKKQKVLERCKFWPVCKSGDECMYHHPTAQCKWVALIEKGQITKALKVHWGLIECCVFGGVFRTFPNCKFGDKCLFVHPNCKYDARCSKPDCPFTHVSRRGTVAPPLRPGTFSLPL